MKSVFTVLLLCALLPGAQAFAAGPEVTTVMTGLDNPRGLAFGPEGALYVAEAGRGGSGPCMVLREVPRCYGPTGAVSRLWWGRQKRVVTGLPSYSDPMNAEVIGPHDVSFRGLGRGYVTVGWGADPALRSSFGPVGRDFGRLIRFIPAFSWWHATDLWWPVADISAYEGSANPAGGPVDSNPYGLLSKRGGGHVVADAGANALLRVSRRGKVSTLAAFRSRPQAATDAVPTSVVRGPDGAYYVGELTGAPFPEGAAVVYRVRPGHEPTVFATGFKTIIDFAFGRDGSLYVLQHATGPVFFVGPGQIVRIRRNGSRSIVMSGLDRPTSLAIGRGGAIYVTNHGTSILTGEVLKIVP